jgi:hypothetical protein
VEIACAVLLFGLLSCAFSCSVFRLPSIITYALPSIRACLGDSSPYVRKTAVVGVAKLYRISPPTIKESDFVDVLYNMLKDKDCGVSDCSSLSGGLGGAWLHVFSCCGGGGCVVPYAYLCHSARFIVRSSRTPFSP